MAFYGEHILPRLINGACGMKTVEPLRRRVREGLGGDVVEFGFGSGLSVPFYPSDIARVSAVEPADLAWKLAEKRLMATSVEVRRSGLYGQLLPFPENTIDAALSTWTLCTIPDVAAALRELRERRAVGAGRTLTSSCATLGRPGGFAAIRIARVDSAGQRRILSARRTRRHHGMRKLRQS